MYLDLILMFAVDSFYMFVNPFIIGVGFSLGWHIIKTKYDKAQMTKNPTKHEGKDD